MSANPSARSGGTGTAISVLKIPPNKTRVVTFLGPLQGSLQHWSKGRTIPCAGDRCPKSLHNDPIRFFAYAPVLVHEPALSLWEAVVLQVSASLEEQLRGRKVRGEVWALSREQHKYDRGPIIGKYLSTISTENLAPEFDMLPSLQRIFGVSYIHLGADNPFPDRLFLPRFALDVSGQIPELAPTKPPEVDQVTLTDFLAHLKNQPKKEGQ